MATPSLGLAQGLWEGPYRPIYPHGDITNDYHFCCEVAHAILIPAGPNQGKVLVFQALLTFVWVPVANDRANAFA